MRPSLKFALLFAGIWFTGKMIFFSTQMFQDSDNYKFLVMWNILCLLMGMTIGIFIEFKGADRSTSTALGDIRKAMGGGMIYAVTVSVLLYVYYAKIDPSYNDSQIEMSIERDRAYLDTPGNFENLRKNDPEYSSLSRDEIMEKRIEAAKQVYSPGTVMTMSLLGMLMLVTVNAIILTIVFRRVLFRQRTI